MSNSYSTFVSLYNSTQKVFSRNFSLNVIRSIHIKCRGQIVNQSNANKAWKTLFEHLNRGLNIFCLTEIMAMYVIGLE
jgi:hypothetical protein